jgi:PAS domain S-box-containing protein
MSIKNLPEALINNIPGIIYRRKNDVNRTLIFIHGNTGKLLGYNPEDFMAGKPLDYNNFILTDDREKVAEIITNAINRNETWEIEYRINHKNGLIRWVQEKGGVISDENGKPVFLDGFILDIDSRKKTEAELKNEQLRLAGIIEGTNIGTWEWNVQSGETVFNERWAEIIGYSLAEISPVSIQTWMDFAHPEDLKKSGELLEKHFSGELKYYEFESRMRHKNGDWIWVLDRGKVISRTADGKPLMMMGTHQDITEQKNRERDLQYKEKILNMFFSQSLTGFFFMMLDKPVEWNDSIDKEKVLDYVFSHQRITRINKAMLEQYGAEEKDFIGLTPKDFFAHDIEHGRRVWRDFFDNGQWHVETSERRFDGSPLSVFGDYICLYDEKGRITGHFGVQIDVTENKEAEKKLMEAKNAAEKANRAKSEFLANMSHEIRTPLNGVIGFTELLEKTPLSPVQQQYLKNVNVSAHSLLSIINDILDFSKIEAGMMELEIIRTDMIELLSQAVDIVKLSAGKKELEILLNIDHEMPRFAHIDAIRLKQILANLLGNAIKFTEQGEVELRVDYEKIEAKKGKLNFCIRDTGVGITEEQQARLFKAFAQGDSSTTRKYGGTGLGLIISELIVRKMGGKIKLNSTPGQGSSFSFSIVADIEHGEKQPVRVSDFIRRCLIIDDNDNNRIILEQMMKNWGVEYECCDNGLSALKVLENSPKFDLIICDYHMPYIDGLETVKMIREKLLLSPEQQAVILLHSSSDDAELHKKCRELGIRFKLTKPITAYELQNYICNLDSSRDELTEKKDCSCAKQDSYEPDKIVEVTVLIAEDNPINLLLAKSLLENMLPAARILEATNGNEVLTIYRENHIDIILMDIQMPELDGIETTTRIRVLEKETGRETPIIALTAGALKENKEKCLKAGMTSFLTKPILSEKLSQVLNQVLHKQKAVFTESGFDRVDLLKRVDNNPELVKKLIINSLELYPQTIEDLGEAINTENPEKIKAEAHKLKGMAMSMGFKNMTYMVKSIEGCYQTCANIKVLKKKYAALQKEWELLSKELQTNI